MSRTKRTAVQGQTAAMKGEASSVAPLWKEQTTTAVAVRSASPSACTQAKDAIAPDPVLIDKATLSQRLGLPSTRMVDTLVRRRLIPHLKLGHKTLRFHYDRVVQALDRLEIQEIGRKPKP